MSRSKSPSPTGRSRHDSLYRGCKKSPRGRSRSPISQRSPTLVASTSSHDYISSSSRRHSLSKDYVPHEVDRSLRIRDRDRHSPSTVRLRRPSLSTEDSTRTGQGSSKYLIQDVIPTPPSNHERHNPGPEAPLPGVEVLKRVEIQLLNPSAEGNCPQNGSVTVPVEDVKIPRQSGEGRVPIFAFLSPVSRLVVIKADPSEVKLKPAEESDCRLSNTCKPIGVLSKPDLKSPSPPHDAYSNRHYRSRSNETFTKAEWERDRVRDRVGNRDHDPDRLHDKNGGRDSRKVESSQQYTRRIIRDNDKNRYERDSFQSRDRERRYQDADRDLERSRERRKEREMDGEKERERLRVKEGDRERESDHSKERGRDRSLVKLETKSDPSTSENKVDDRPSHEHRSQEESRPSEDRKPRDERRSRDANQHYMHPATPYMDFPRVRGPGFGPLGPPPPFMGRPYGPGPFVPYVPFGHPRGPPPYHTRMGPPSRPPRFK